MDASFVMGKGKVIVIEGSDKAGKGTQSRLLVDALKLSGKVCVIIDFPDYTTPIGAEIRAFLDGKRNYPNELKHMLFSANRWEKKREIESMVNNGTIIIINRYYQSNLAYGISNGLNINWLLNLDKGLPKEDLVIVLEVSSKMSHQRTAAEYNDTFEKDQKLMVDVHKNYRVLARKFKWKIINGEKNREEVHQDIMKIIKSLKV
ncbi:MAG TPA: dTMP kinase [Nitrososphaeraceae archaeon]|jgi:dTMP kinase|nr:dTMP kinase [Nitrososphaeraceae archaeon]